LAATVVAGHALVDDTLPEPAQRVVRAMCLYALEVQAGAEPGPYSDERALVYAREALGDPTP
jgi:hypothetical protein